MRWLRPIRRTATGLAAAFGAEVQVAYNRIFAATINTPREAQFMAGVAADVVGEQNVVRNPAPEMGSEDFSFLLQERPGCYFLLGQGNPEHRACVHDPRYDFNDDILPIGATMWVRTVEKRLG